MKSILAVVLISAGALQTSRSEIIVADEVRFSPSVGQPIFPAGNLNVFKQYKLGFDVSERIGDTVEINLLFTTLEFGGEVAAGFNAQFGLEMGLCLGGNSDFDLGFIPTVMLPQRYPSEIPIPITVSEGLQPDSHFTTTFPPLGKMYADLIMDVGTNLKAEACVFGCFTPIDFNFSTCDIPALQPSGVKLFNESVRCDPALNAEKYCAIELASFNRNDDNKARIINVGAGNLAEFLAEPYLEFAPSISNDKSFTGDAFTDTLTVSGSHVFLNRAPVRISGNSLPGGLSASKTYYIKATSVTGAVGTVFQLALSPGGNAVDLTANGSGKLSPANIETPDDPLSGRYGTLSIAAPTINTDSNDSEFNTADKLKSSGAEDVLGVGIDIAQMFADFLLPPGFPPLSDGGSLGPIDWDYTLASLNLGPAIQLQMDFEMDWDLSVTEMTFTVPNTTTPKPVNLVSPSGTRLGTGVSKLTDIAPAGTYHLTNCGPNALPLVSLITDFPLSGGQKPVEVNITYVLKPRLKTNVSVPIIGKLDYTVLSAGAAISRIGDLRIGPLLEGEHKFKFGEFNVYDGDPSEIQSTGTGRIKFVMQSSGPPSFDWNPSQYTGNPNPFRWTSISGGITNWAEVVSVPVARNSFPGMGGPNSDAMIHTGPQVKLDESIDIATLCINRNASLRIYTELTGSGGGTPRQLAVTGLVENSGFINIDGSISNSASLKLDSPTAVLCGSGTIQLSGGGAITGYTGPEPFAFCNYNFISGAGEVMNLRGLNPAGSSLHNNGFLIASGSSSIVNNSITVSLKLDNFPTDTSWVVRNGSNGIVMSGSGYNQSQAGQTVLSTAVLSPGAYTFTLTDSFGDGICCDQGNGNFAIRNGDGVTLASGAPFGFTSSANFNVFDNSTLRTSAELIVNENAMQTTAGNTLSITADRFVNRDSSYATAQGSGGLIDFRCLEIEHAGIISAQNSGRVSIDRMAPGIPSIWNAGQSLNPNSGVVRATGSGVIDIRNTTVNGGYFTTSTDGNLFTAFSTFNCTDIRIGDTDYVGNNQLSASMTIAGGTNQVFTKTCLNNYGTMNVLGPAEFVDPLLFANHGTVKVGAFGELHIREKTIQTQGASSEARSQPGAANTTRNAILGGIWDISGTLTIDGAFFNTIGGNAAPASTGSGSVNELPMNGNMPVATFDPEDDESRNLAGGAPATVILRGTNWVFPELQPLSNNRGTLQLTEGAQLSVNTIFFNENELIIDSNSKLSVNGTFTQQGANSRTTIASSGMLDSLTDDYVIKGGTFTGSGDGVLGVIGGVLTSGTKLRVESPVEDTNEVFYKRLVTDVSNGPAISTIASGAEMTFHGSDVNYPGLINNLRTVNGKFVFSGGGKSNSPNESFARSTGQTITSTGEIDILGFNTTFFTSNLTQTGVNSKTVVGAGANLTVAQSLIVDGGEFVVQIGARPSLDQSATLKVTTANFNNRLTIDFVDDLAVAGSSVDIGDTWFIMPTTVSTNLSGVDFVTYTLAGNTIPNDWLPNGSRLEVIRIPTDRGLRGLAVRVAPISGFISYDAWADSAGLNPAGFLADPFQPRPQPGVTNLDAFIFGVDGVSKFSTSQGQGLSFVKGADGNDYPQLVFTRPFGTKANYDPYYSADLVTWRRAPMIVKPSGVTPTAGDMETVTLESSYPFSEKKLFFRIGGVSNPEDFDLGEIPDKLIPWDSDLINFDQSLATRFAPVSYTVEPGKTLFLEVTGAFGGGTVNGGTAADGITRNFIYRDNSRVSSACIHAGLLNNGQRGIIRVTFLPTQQTPFIGSTQNAGTSNEITSIGSTILTAPYSYRVELVSIF